MAARFPSVAALADPTALSEILGDVAAVERKTLVGAGFSGARHERLRVRLSDGASRALVLKHLHLDTDFTATRTVDRIGRETVLASAPRAEVWRVFRSPYVGWARARDGVAVLMEDVSDGLLPDARQPLERWQEETLLAALARLHATYWERPVTRARWVAKGWDVERLLLETADAVAPLPPTPLTDQVRAGWAIVSARLPGVVVRALFADVARVRAETAPLPRTLVHGDAKVANFALRSGEVWAFDWACAGAAPPSLELGWFLAVNASRLTRSKEAVASRYRQLLEEQRGEPFAEATWAALLAHALRAGARMLLWSKAAACARGGDGAEAEWAWWADRLPGALGIATRE